MKLNGIFGKGSGKVGESVWAVSGGVQIVRPYNPNVTNPQTPAQVEQRAKFKLMSQLASALANAIAMKKNGLRSSRNQFVSKNIGLVSYSNGEASVNLGSLRLTNGTAAFPEISVTKGTGSTVNLALLSAAPNNVGAVIYAAYLKTENLKLQEVAVKIVETPGAGNTFPTTIDVTGGEIVVYAYGVRNVDSITGVNYGDYSVYEEQLDAKLVADTISRIDPANLTVTVSQSLTLE